MNRPFHILRTNAIALVALFFALGGTAVAAGGLITGDKIAAETITSTNLKNGSVAGVDVAPSTITGANVADGSVSFLDIGKDSVATYHITDQSITNADLEGGTVGLSKLNQTSTLNTGVGLLAPDACKNVMVGGLPAGSLTVAMATTPSATAAASAPTASGAATVTVCNHGSVWANPGFKLVAFRY